jgi:thiosulfate reductase cytochrome b subunit
MQLEWWPFVALGLIGLAVGLGYVFRAITSGPTRHEHSPQYKRIKRAVDDGLKQEQDNGGTDDGHT